MDFDNEADRPLRDDIRLLGRLLGDTVRDQEGSPSFDVVESVRQSAIALHRDENVAAPRDLERLLAMPFKYAIPFAVVALRTVLLVLLLLLMKRTLKETTTTNRML